MTSEAKIAANQKNARRSTGPRTAPAKTRVRRNALRHGLAAVVLIDPARVAEVDRIADAICDQKADRSERDPAIIIAEAQATLKRVREVRAGIMEQMCKAQDPIGGAPRDALLKKLLRLERYERRAISRRKRALRQAIDPKGSPATDGGAAV